MGKKEYFFDTYAFFELIDGNPRYLSLEKDAFIATTSLNLLELYYGLSLRSTIENANIAFNELKKYCVQFSPDIMPEVGLFKLANKEKRLSYIDCLGYIISLKLGIPFLTGDKEFKGMANVEFVK
ncbi:MAG: PIN domain-containing protein [Candidatus Woesearchaeota archaeon]